MALLKLGFIDALGEEFRLPRVCFNYHGTKAAYWNLKANKPSATSQITSEFQELLHIPEIPTPLTSFSPTHWIYEKDTSFFFLALVRCWTTAMNSEFKRKYWQWSLKQKVNQVNNSVNLSTKWASQVSILIRQINRWVWR